MYLLQPCVELKLKNATKEKKETTKGVIRRRTGILLICTYTHFKRASTADIALGQHMCFVDQYTSFSLAV
jgi:hypothetical protein